MDGQPSVVTVAGHFDQAARVQDEGAGPRIKDQKLGSRSKDPGVGSRIRIG